MTEPDPQPPPPHPLGDRLPPWFTRALLYIAVAVAAYTVTQGLLRQIKGLLITLVVSLFLSFAMEPAVNALVRRGWRRGRATGLVFVVFFIGGGAFTYVMVDLMVRETAHLAEKAPDYVNDITDWINNRFNTDITSKDLTKRLNDYQSDLSNLATNVGGRVVSLSAAVLGGVFQIFTIALFAFYFVADGPRLRSTICSVLPADRQRLVIRLWELAIEKTGGYIYSRLLLASLASICSWIVFAVLRLPSSLALAIWLGLFSQFVPVIGTYLAGALPLLIALLNRPVAALVVAIFLVVYQQVENYVVAPKVTSRTMDIHPAVAFGAVIAGAGILGGVGTLLALPAAAIVQAFISAYLARHDLIDEVRGDGADVAAATSSGATPDSGTPAAPLRSLAAHPNWLDRLGERARRRSHAGHGDEPWSPSAPAPAHPDEHPGEDLTPHPGEDLGEDHTALPGEDPGSE